MALEILWPPKSVISRAMSFCRSYSGSDSGRLEPEIERSRCIERQTDGRTAEISGGSRDFIVLLSLSNAQAPLVMDGAMDAVGKTLASVDCASPLRTGILFSAKFTSN